MRKRDGGDQARYKFAMLIPGHPRIDANPEICGGRPCIAGTRMRVMDILEALAHGDSQEEILADLPYISAEDIRACLAFGAAATNHPIITAEAAE